MRRILITVSASVSAFALVAMGAAQAQAPVDASGAEGQVLPNCPPGYICSTLQLPRSAPARQLTPEEIDQVRSDIAAIVDLQISTQKLDEIAR